MNLKNTFILMIVFIVLGSFAMFDPLKMKKKGEEKKERETKVLWLKDKRLESISLTTEKGKFRFECAGQEGCPFDRDARWNLVEPVLDNGDDSAIASLASAVLNLTSEDRVDLDNEPDPVEFGLNGNRGTIELNVRGEKDIYRLQLGKESPTGGTIYAYTNRAAKRLFLIPAYFADHFKKDLFHWRNKRLFPAVESEIIEKISWKGPKDPLIAFEKSKNTWTMKAPTEAPANFIHIEGLASTLSYLAAVEILPETTKVQSLGPPYLSLTFQAKGAEYSLKVFEDKEKKPTGKKFIAQASGQKQFYKVDAAQFDRFLKKAMDYRNRTLLSIEERDRVQELNFRFPRDKKEISFKKDTGDWKRSGGEEVKEALSADRIRDFVEAMATSDIERFTSQASDLQKFTKQSSDVEVELKDALGAVLKKQRFLIEGRKELFTESDRQGELRVITGHLLKALPVRIQDFLVAANQKVVTSPEKENHGKDVIQPEHIH